MTTTLQIDFISDVACPWCAIGLHSLEEALRRTAGRVDAAITFHPYELNPDMPAGGRAHDEYLAERYGAPAAQMAAARENVKACAAAVGFAFNATADSRIHNTFDAHRLLHWAQGEGRQRELEHALFRANFTDNADISDHAVLLDVAASAGLDPAGARAVLESDRGVREVRAAEQLWSARGIQGVPAIVIAGRWLISGGQPPEVFEQALLRIAEGADAAD